MFGFRSKYQKKTLLILLTLSMIIGGFICLFNRQYDKTPDKSFMYQNIQVDVYGPYTENIDYYLEDLKNIPNAYKKYLKLLVFTNRNLTTESNSNNLIKEDDYLAVSNGLSNSITIDSTRYDETTLLHECFHLIDFCTLENGETLSMTNEFRRLYKEEGDKLRLNTYLQSDMKEAFVGCCLEYYYNSDFKQNAPNLYDFIQKNIN